MKQWKFLACWLVGTAAVATAAARYVVWRDSRQAAISAANDPMKGQDSEAQFHEWMHANLGITESQHQALSAAETKYLKQRKMMRVEVEKANSVLASAVRNSTVFQGDVEAALDKLAAAQQALQRATLDHFFTMKQSLTLAQQEKLLLWTHDSLITH